MAKKLEIKGFKCVVTDTITGIEEFRAPSKDVRDTNFVGNDIITLYENGVAKKNYNWNDLVDSTGTTFASKAAVLTFFENNTGFSLAGSTAQTTKTYIDRVKADGGTIIGSTADILVPLKKTALMKPKLVLLPNGIKAGKVYAQLPTDGTGDGTFTRNGTATYIENGVVKTADANVPRIQDGAFLLEPQATQLYQQTETLTTQTKTTTAATYTVSFWGTGTITFSGTYVGSLVGVDANTRVTKTFTATAGALVSTISGTVTKGQLELGSYATSYIPNTGTGTVTRIKDTLSNIGNVTTFNSEEGTLFIDVSCLVNGGSNRIINLNKSGVNETRVSISFSSTKNRVQCYIAENSVIKASLDSLSKNQTDELKIAATWKQNEFKFFINGIKIGKNLIGDTFTINTLDNIDFDYSTSHFYGKVKQLQVFKTALSDAELMQLTS